MKPTFEEQYQKIVSAYYKNELKPLVSCACFIGNLLNKKRDWTSIRIAGDEGFKIRPIKDDLYNYSLVFIYEISGGLYTPEDIVRMENNFVTKCYPSNEEDNLTEESLFHAMESTLEMLRKIHESTGEVVKDYNFTKRELCIKETIKGE